MLAAGRPTEDFLLICGERIKLYHILAGSTILFVWLIDENGRAASFIFLQI